MPPRSGQYSSFWEEDGEGSPSFAQGDDRRAKKDKLYEFNKHKKTVQKRQQGSAIGGKIRKPKIIGSRLKL